MILNAYAVLDAFVCLLRLLLALFVLKLGLTACRQSLRTANAISTTTGESNYYLMFLLALVLAGLNVVSWPLLVLLLQSYVPEWSETMCIFGVTQIGAGSLGPARFLPRLISMLQVTKPAVVFLSGAWLVLHLCNRNTGSASWMRCTCLVLVAQSLLAGIDAAAESAYLGIPKKESFLPAGCCTVAPPQRGNLPPTIAGEWFGVASIPVLWAAYYVLNAGVVTALYSTTMLRLRTVGVVWLSTLMVLATAIAPISWLFLTEIAAPMLLHLPLHHCIYDLITRVPETILAIGLHLVGAFAIGWANIVAWCSDSPEMQPAAARWTGTLLRLAIHGYGGSIVMITSGLVMA